MAELLTKATLERPKDTKDRADQRLARAQAASEGAQGRTGGEPIHVSMSDCDLNGLLMYFTTTLDSARIRTEGMSVLSGSPPTVFVADKAGAARIDTEGEKTVWWSNLTTYA